MTTHSSTSRSQPERPSSLLPAIIVNPAPGPSEDPNGARDKRRAQTTTQAEQLAAFLEALAGVVRGDVQTGSRTAAGSYSAPPPPGAAGIGPARPVPGGQDAPQDEPVDAFAPALLYHLMCALRNLNHFVFITPGPRGLLFIVHLPRKTLVLILFALFLMFASVYRLPEVWEIMFGIIGIF